jgi:peptidoglycan/xylan/chitin deacetylase (PgdA/CDA1 family)
MIVPVFFREPQEQGNIRIFLSFDAADNEQLAAWCSELASVLSEEDVRATVFFSGKVAENNPSLLGYFGDGIDIGSQTYSYVDLSTISDFEVQLDEVKSGKEAVDDAGNLYSRVFRAPYGGTDENIYYILSQSDIIADFSYTQQYNLYQDGQFLRYNAIAYEGSLDAVKLITDNPSASNVYILTFDSSCSVQQIRDVLSALKEVDVVFVNASDLAEVDLTGRGE